MTWCRFCFGTHTLVNEHSDCHKLAAEVAEEEPFWLPEPIVGWRGFRVVTIGDEVFLQGQRTIWTSADPGPAQCLPYGGYGYVYPLVHSAPHPLCACGYHVLRERNDVKPSWDAIAKVEGWGEAIEHEMGWRVQKIKLLGIEPRSIVFSSMKYEATIRKLLSQAYEKYEVGGIPVEDRKA